MDIDHATRQEVYPWRSDDPDQLIVVFASSDPGSACNYILLRSRQIAGVVRSLRNREYDVLLHDGRSIRSLTTPSAVVIDPDAASALSPAPPKFDGLVTIKGHDKSVIYTTPEEILWINSVGGADPDRPVSRVMTARGGLIESADSAEMLASRLDSARREARERSDRR